MALPVPVVMHEYETPESRAIRLSAANGFRSFSSFMRITGMTPRGLEKGESASIAELAQWAGADHQLVGRYAAESASRHHTWRLGDAVFAKEGRCGRRFRFCAACVLDDIENGTGPVASRAYVRPSWICRTVRNCVKHSTALRETPWPTRGDRDFCQFVKASIGAVRKAADEALHVQWTEVDRFCEERIRGVSAERYLGMLEVHVAVGLCHYLGTFMRKYRQCLKLLPESLRRAPAREIGFYVARQGEEAIGDVVRGIIEHARPKGVRKFLFGSLGLWLRRNADREEFAGILNLFQDTAVRSLPFAAGDVCFVVVEKRRLHSVRTAAKEYGLHDRRVADLVKAAGLVQDVNLPTALIYFEADKAHEILQAATRTMTSAEARMELGLSEKIMTKLLQRGFLPRVEVRHGERNYSRIRREDLEAFLDRIFTNATEGYVPPDWLDIDQLCKTAQVHKGAVLTALLDGTLVNVMAPVGHGRRLNSLRYDPIVAVEQLVAKRPLLDEVADVPVLSQREAQTYMKVKTDTIPFLLRSGYLEPVLVKNPRSCRMQVAVSVAALESFMAEYVAVSEVAATYGTHTNIVLAAFEKLGIRPVYADSGKVTRFFRRAEIVEVPVRIPAPLKKRRKR